MANTARLARFADYALLLLRVGAGLMLALLHGWAKARGAWAYLFQGAEWRFIGMVDNLGAPIPALFAVLGAVIEFAGGLLLALGLFTRYAAAGVTLLTAGAVYHHLTSDMRYELAAVYLLIGVAFTFSDAGRFTLDNAIRKTRRV